MTYTDFRNQFPDTQKFMDAFGSLACEEAKALIDAEMCSPGDRAGMMDTWHEARRLVKLWNIGVFYTDTGSLTITFFEYDSEFSGNDFEYRYSLEPDYAAEFLKMIPRQQGDARKDIQEWLVENIDCRGRGLDLQSKWIDMGLHGVAVDWEDYPGGIHHIWEF